ncbi:MAG: CapA family protein [Bryobacteraceae bacterium]|jgi:poly-gamma-glutamate synthesis protein (capsule biosynthesis protein)
MKKGSRARTRVSIVVLLLLIVALVASRHCRDSLRRRPARQQPAGRTSAGEVTEETRVILAGDIMLSRAVAAHMKRAGDWDLPFRNMAGFLRSADVSFANLESPFSGEEGFHATKSLVFNAPPESVQGLEEYGFRVVSLANNHALDQGPRGVAYTRKHLEEHHIQTVGAGQTQEEAWRPAILEIRNTKIGFLAASYASFNDAGRATNPYVARTGDLDRLKAAISDLRSQRAFIIVSMHAGEEYTSKPRDGQIRFARAAIDAGANVVVGHHPHWIQPVEKYKGGLIFYSLGNFIFDQGYSMKTREGMAVRLHIRGQRLLSAESQPIVIQHFCCPQPATGQEPQVVRP